LYLYEKYITLSRDLQTCSYLLFHLMGSVTPFPQTWISFCNIIYDYKWNFFFQYSSCMWDPPPLFLPIKIWIWIVVLLNWRCIFIVKSNVKCLHESTGAWGMDFVSSSPLLFSTTPLFSKFSYKSFLFQNVHNHSFFFIWQ
jgi:hypothetical protein